jgi:hypothetical protein
MVSDQRVINADRTAMSDVTPILTAINQGDPSAVDQLLPLVYDELCKLAAQKMATLRTSWRESIGVISRSFEVLLLAPGNGVGQRRNQQKPCGELS